MRRRTLFRSGITAGVASGLGAVPALAQDDVDPYEPLGRVPVDGAAEAVVGDDGETAYVAAIDGFETVDVSDPVEPTRLAQRRDVAADVDGGPITEILDVDVARDRLAVAGPANPSNSPNFEGFVVYDVSDPANPVLVTDPYETGFPIHNCYLEGDMLYTVAVENGRNPLVIHDVSGDDIEEVGRWSLLEHDDGWGAVDWRIWNLHDVTVRGDVAVLSYWDAGTRLLNVSDPTAPTYVGGVSGADPADLEGVDPRAAQTALPGNDHYAVLDDDGTLLAVGRESWAAGPSDTDGAGGIDLYDVSDPTDPVHRSTIEPPESNAGTYRSGWWTTAHNLELRDDRLFSSWYRGGVKVHDVADPAEPEELAWWRDPENAAFWTARVIEPGETFVASSTPVVPNAPTEGALYTFPIRAGEQSDPPSLTEFGASDGDSASDSENGTDGENGTDDGSETDDGAGNASETGNDTGSQDGVSAGNDAGSNASNENGTGNETNDTDDGDDEPTPGFTGPATVAAGALGLEWLRRRSDDGE